MFSKKGKCFRPTKGSNISAWWFFTQYLIDISYHCTTISEHLHFWNIFYRISFACAIIFLAILYRVYYHGSCWIHFGVLLAWFIHQSVCEYWYKFHYIYTYIGYTQMNVCYTINSSYNFNGKTRRRSRTCQMMVILSLLLSMKIEVYFIFRI